jgi:hypothetical protein
VKMRRIEITGLEDEPIVCSLDSFFAENTDGLTPEDVTAIEALGVGESFTGGGGASIAWTVTRTA